MLTSDLFAQIIEILGEQAQADLADAQSLQPPQTPEAFADEIIYIICNAGMKNDIARRIRKKCMSALKSGKTASSVFQHPTKARAIDSVWSNRNKYFDVYKKLKNDNDRLSFLTTLPWIGPTTKYHAAKSFGMQIAKPDRHLERLAVLENTSSQGLCERLAGETGFSVPQIDTVLWRACSLNILDSKTGKLTGSRLPADYQVHKPSRPNQ